jgi:hypothetical protein
MRGRCPLAAGAWNSSSTLTSVSCWALIFVVPPLFAFVRHPRSIFLLFAALMGLAGFRSIQRIYRAGDGSYIHAYLVLLCLLLSAGMMTAAGSAEGVRHCASEPRPLDSIMVEPDVDPPDPGFVEAMSRLNEAGATRPIAKRSRVRREEPPRR